MTRIAFGSPGDAWIMEFQTHCYAKTYKPCIILKNDIVTATCAIFKPMNDLQELIDGCKQSDRIAQRELYDTYASRFLSVCMRYLPQRDEAEDALTEGFLKIFDKIDTYSEQGSFEGWMRRIMVNECLMVLRKKKRLPHFEIPENTVIPVDPQGMSQLIQADLMNLLQYLPEGYRTVFSLYVLDGFKHREIAEILGVSINTSKSQLILARKRLVELLDKINYEIS